MAGVFISYRREDTSGEANHLAADLSDQLGRDQVFIDIDTISPGVDFERRIDEALTTCDLVLVLIGNRWLEATDSEGRRRLDHDGDFVRLEVAKALERPDVTVVPVLVEGAQMPAPEQLPPQIADLSKRNALDLASKRWRYDVGQIVRLIKGESLGERLGRLPRWLKMGVPLVAAAGVLAAVVLAGGEPEGGDGGGGDAEALPPATVASAVGLCEEQRQFGANGTVGPLTCADGSVNRLAWEYIAEELNPVTFTLGPDATPEEVAAALCEDLDTYPIAEMIYEISSAYYGWSFGLDPVPDSSGEGFNTCE